MRDIQASEAKTHLPSILDDVERGEIVRITRHGRPIARIVPEAASRREQVEQAIKEFQALRRDIGKMSMEEIISSIHEGHKY